MLEIGSQAPDFSLKDQSGKTVQLAKFAGRRVLLSFRPLAWTNVCHDQMLLLEEFHSRFDDLNTIAFGIGVDSVPSNKAWAQSMSIVNTRLLADFWPHGEVVKKFGIFREKDGFSERATIIIDEKQKIVFAKIYPTAQLPSFEEVFQFLER